MKFNKKVTEIKDFIKNLDNGFEDILDLSKSCKFSDCTHTNETDCAVKKAISDGIISEETFNHYYKDRYEAEYVSKNKNKTKAIEYMKQRKLYIRS